MTQPPNPPYAQPAPPPPNPQQSGIIRITVQGSALKTFTPPTIRLNGQPVYSTWGTYDIPVPPGRYVVEGEAHSLWSYGRAALEFTVEAGQVVPVFYSSPMVTFVSGAIGHVKQKTPGVAALTLILVAAAAVLIAGVVAAIVS